jgi:hypothetical protein
MNGKVMPLAGMSWMVEAMLMAACRPNCTARPVAARVMNRLVSFEAPRHRAHGDEGEQRQDHQADDQAEFLAGDRHDEVGMGVGKLGLHRALARDRGRTASRS